MISGPEDIVAFLDGLTPQLLVRVVADLLFFDGHAEIRCTDGPGDGGRDIHSVKERRKHLTQCKWHKRRSATVPSEELNSFAASLVKFGLKDGLFVTTAKISPQAKRELLDSFPDYKLSFLEGTNLASRVLSNPVLRSLWLDGGKLAEVAKTVSFLIIARECARSRPIKLAVPPTLMEKIRVELNEPDLVLALDPAGRVSADWFPDYSPPAIRTFSEFAGFVSGVSVTIRGSDALTKLEKVYEVVARAFTQIAASDCATVLTFSSARLVPLAGPQAGAMIPIQERPPPCLRMHPDGTARLDVAWFLPGEEWLWPNSLQSSTAEWVRWYHPAKDIVVAVEAGSAITAEQRSFVDQMADQRLKWIESSLFIFAPDFETLRAGLRRDQQPDAAYTWVDGRTYACWLHPFLNGGPVDMGIETDDENESHSIFAAEIRAHSDKTSFLKNFWLQHRAELLHPLRGAYCYAALSGTALFPVSTRKLLRSVDFLRGAYPRPLDTTERILTFTCSWEVPAGVDVSNSDLADLLTGLRGPESRARMDSNCSRPGARFVLLDVFFERLDPLVSVAEFLGKESEALGRYFDEYESALVARFLAPFQRATRRYWNEEYLLDFVPMHPSLVF